MLSNKRRISNYSSIYTKEPKFTLEPPKRIINTELLKLKKPQQRISSLSTIEQAFTNKILPKKVVFITDIDMKDMFNELDSKNYTIPNHIKKKEVLIQSITSQGTYKKHKINQTINTIKPINIIELDIPDIYKEVIETIKENNYYDVEYNFNKGVTQNRLRDFLTKTHKIYTNKNNITSISGSFEPYKIARIIIVKVLENQLPSVDIIISDNEDEVIVSVKNS